MFKLESIWDKQKITEHIMNSFNDIVSINPNIETITLKDAWSVQMIIYQYVHTLRRCYCKYDDSDTEIAFDDLKDIISHNVVQLVNEVKMLVKTCELEKLGKSHNKTNTRPYNNDTSEVDNTIIDNVSYTDINSLSILIEFVKNNSIYLKSIYKEISTIVVMIYGV